MDQPKLEPGKASVKVAEQAEDTTINDLLAWLDTLEHEDAVPNVPESSGLNAFLSELPYLSEYVAEGGCTKQRVVAMGLGDSENTIPDVPDTLNLTTCLNNSPVSLSTGQKAPTPQSQWRWRGWRTSGSWVTAPTLPLSSASSLTSLSTWQRVAALRTEWWPWVWETARTPSLASLISQTASRSSKISLSMWQREPAPRTKHWWHV